MSFPIAEKKYLGRHNFEDVEYLKKGNGNAAISLFTGCGGAALGINQAGFEVRVMVEWDKDACNTLRCNWTLKGIQEMHDGYKIVNERRKKEGLPPIIPKRIQKREPAILQADITKLSTEEILKAGDLRVGETALLEGGFPCQGFSTAHSGRSMEDPRNRLYEECVRVIRGALPKAFFLENVPGLVSMEKGKIIRMICNDLANSGYQISWDILDACDYGVPQHRKRVIIIGLRNDVGVMLLDSDVSQLHIGGSSGPIKHPKWFEDRYPEKVQGSLFDLIKKNEQKTNIKNH